MRILGIDPGLSSCGWGVIDVIGSKINHVANGVCSPKKAPLAVRLAEQYRELSDVITTYQPISAAVEETFVNKDARSTLKLGQARGVSVLVPAIFGLEVGEYSPNRIKKTVTGVGHASKEQIAYMLKIFFPGVKIISSDSADALAVAICHGRYMPTQKTYEARR